MAAPIEITPTRVSTSLPPSSSNPLGRARILIVEDDKLTGRTIARMVEALGHDTVLCHTWAQAIERFSGDAVDLVLMDAIMPGIDGFRLTQMLRERTTSYVPVVFLTGLTDAENRKRATDCGADDFLTKPVDQFDLRVRMMAMLRIRRLTRALEVRTRRLAQLAKIDNLTGLLNRHSMAERLPEEVDHALLRGEPLSILMLDIDDFKKVNDEHGHPVGDMVIAMTSQVIDEEVRPNDLAFRYGGEEFLIACPGMSSAQAGSLGERICAGFRDRTMLSSSSGRQTVSVGVASIADVDAATWMSTADVLAAVLKAADSALYRAKQGGKDRVELAK